MRGGGGEACGLVFTGRGGAGPASTSSAGRVVGASPPAQETKEAEKRNDKSERKGEEKRRGG